METPTIYLELNIKASTKKLSDYIDNYNEQLQSDKPMEYKKLTVKGSQKNSAEKLLKAYYNHLVLAAKMKSKRNFPFKVNNVALATMLGGTTVKRTAANHIAKLEEAGLIKKKFMGTRTGFTIEFNPEILVAMPNETFSNELEACYQQVVDNGHADSPEERQIIQSLTPSFSVFSNGMGKILPHIAARTLQELNFNMRLGIVDNSESTPQAPQDSEINNKISNAAVSVGNSSPEQQEPVQEHGMQKMMLDFPSDLDSPEGKIEKKLRPAPAISLSEIQRREKIFDFALMAWHFILANLYDNRSFKDNDVRISIDFLRKYFEQYAANRNTIGEAFNKLVFRVILARKYVLRNVGSYIPNPRVWLDPTFAQGFSGTEAWLITVHQKQKENADYYSNIKLVSELYRQFAADPGVFNYQSARQTLGKKKNKEYLQMFDDAVLKHPSIQKFNPINQSNHVA